MKLDIKKFSDQNIWIKSVTDDLIKEAVNAIAVNNSANILLSGGSTPGPIYKMLSKADLKFDKLKVGLVDERFVPTNSEFSNEKLLKTCFTVNNKQVVDIIGMVKDTENKKNNLQLVKQSYAPFIERTDIIVLGMGNDGHTASIFPWDPDSYDIRSNSLVDIFTTKAPTDPKNRITCSLEMITNAKNLFLLISGAEKLKVMQEYQNNLPIHSVLERRSDIKIYYLEK